MGYGAQIYTLDSIRRLIIPDPDLDGVATAATISLEEGIPVNHINYVPPYVMQNGELYSTIWRMPNLEEIIIADLPLPKSYIDEVSRTENPVLYFDGREIRVKWLDHHLGNINEVNPAIAEIIPGRRELRDSCSSVASTLYGKFKKYRRMTDEVDRIDSARITRDDILNPGPYFLLFGIINRYNIDTQFYRHVAHLFQDMVTDSLGIEYVLDDPQVKQRVGRYLELLPNALKYAGENIDRSMKESSQYMTKRTREKVAVMDISDIGRPENSKFLEEMNSLKYAPYIKRPNCEISLTIAPGSDPSYRDMMRVLVAKNMWSDPMPGIDLSDLMKRYKGGGHSSSSGTMVPRNQVPYVKEGILSSLDRYYQGKVF